MLPFIFDSMWLMATLSIFSITIWLVKFMWRNLIELVHFVLFSNLSRSSWLVNSNNNGTVTVYIFPFSSSSLTIVVAREIMRFRRTYLSNVWSAWIVSIHLCSMHSSLSRSHQWDSSVWFRHTGHQIVIRTHSLTTLFPSWSVSDTKINDKMYDRTVIW